jgi:hypothetical protein
MQIAGNVTFMKMIPGKRTRWKPAQESRTLYSGKRQTLPAPFVKTKKVEISF